VNPVRLVRRRSRGFKLVSPNGLPNAYVGRPTRWQNPYRIGPDGTRTDVIRKFSDLIQRYDGTLQGFLFAETLQGEIKASLAGKNLVCWCRKRECPKCDADFSDRTETVCPMCGGPVEAVQCHADILLAIANQ